MPYDLAFIHIPQLWNPFDYVTPPAVILSEVSETNVVELRSSAARRNLGRSKPYPNYEIHSTSGVNALRSGTPKTYFVRFGEPLAAQDDI